MSSNTLDSIGLDWIRLVEGSQQPGRPHEDGLVIHWSQDFKGAAQMSEDRDREDSWLLAILSELTTGLRKKTVQKSAEKKQSTPESDIHTHTYTHICTDTLNKVHAYTHA